MQFVRYFIFISCSNEDNHTKHTRAKLLRLQLSKEPRAFFIEALYGNN